MRQYPTSDAEHAATSDRQKAISHGDLATRAVTCLRRQLAELPLLGYAIQDYDEAIRLDPTDTSPYINRGLSRNKLGQYEQAIQDFSEAIKLDPTEAITYAWRSTLHGYLGNSTEAERDFQKATELGYTP